MRAMEREVRYCTSAGVTFKDRGERDLKRVGDPVRVWAVREE